MNPLEIIVIGTILSALSHSDIELDTFPYKRGLISLILTEWRITKEHKNVFFLELKIFICFMWLKKMAWFFQNPPKIKPIPHFLPNCFSRTINHYLRKDSKRNLFGPVFRYMKSLYLNGNQL